MENGPRSRRPGNKDRDSQWPDAPTRPPAAVGAAGDAAGKPAWSRHPGWRGPFASRARGGHPNRIHHTPSRRLLRFQATSILRRCGPAAAPAASILIGLHVDARRTRLAPALIDHARRLLERRRDRPRDRARSCGRPATRVNGRPALRPHRRRPPLRCHATADHHGRLQTIPPRRRDRRLFHRAERATRQPRTRCRGRRPRLPRRPGPCRARTTSLRCDLYLEYRRRERAARDHHRLRGPVGVLERPATCIRCGAHHQAQAHPARHGRPAHWHGHGQRAAPG